MEAEQRYGVPTILAVHAGRKLGRFFTREPNLGPAQGILHFDAFIGDRDHESRLFVLAKFALGPARPQRYVSGEAAGGANACRWGVLAGDGVLGSDWNVVAFVGGVDPCTAVECRDSCRAEQAACTLCTCTIIVITPRMYVRVKPMNAFSSYFLGRSFPLSRYFIRALNTKFNSTSRTPQGKPTMVATS